MIGCIILLERKCFQRSYSHSSHNCVVINMGKHIHISKFKAIDYLSKWAEQWNTEQKFLEGHNGLWLLKFRWKAKNCFFNKHAKHSTNFQIIPLRLMSKQEMLFCALKARWCYYVNRSFQKAVNIISKKIWSF